MGDWDVVSTTPAWARDRLASGTLSRRLRRGAADAEARAIRTAIQHTATVRAATALRAGAPSDRGCKTLSQTGVGLIVNPREAGQRSSARWRRGHEVGARMNDPRKLRAAPPFG